MGFTGTMLVPTLSFWLFNALLMVVDTTGKPNFITRYRIQADKNNPVPSFFSSLVKKGLPILFNNPFLSTDCFMRNVVVGAI